MDNLPWWPKQVYFQLRTCLGVSCIFGRDSNPQRQMRCDLGLPEDLRKAVSFMPGRVSRLNTTAGDGQGVVSPLFQA
jgi:hypothetical protein